MAAAAENYPSGGDGRTGLKNLGNTCYLSSIFQSMAHCCPLRYFFLSQPIESLVNWERPADKDGWTAFFVALYIRQLWSNKFSNCRIVQLKSQMGRIDQEFAGTRQCDAQEFLSFFMGGMQSDLRRAAAFGLQVGPSDATNPHSLAAQKWAAFKSKEDSVIVDLFYHQKMTTIVCGSCKKARHRVENTYLTQVNLEKKGKQSLNNQLLKGFSEYDSEVPLECESCGRRSISEQRESFWSLPEIMIIHLKRFQMDYNQRTGAMDSSKIDSRVDFPIMDLDVEDFCHDDNPQTNTKYDLFAVVNHEGGVGSGHYIAICRPSHGTKDLGWRKFDDQNVTDVTNQKHLVTSDAYILFYRRRPAERRQSTTRRKQTAV